jgi:hypothetical protein
MKRLYEKKWLTKPFHRLSQFSVSYENDTRLIVAETMAHRVAILAANSQSRLAYHISALTGARGEPTFHLSTPSIPSHRINP